MGPGIVLLFAIIAILGLPALCVGAILRLVEWSWEKRRWSLGSGFLLAAGGLLCLPLLIWIVWAELMFLIR
jgi:hypothetical protein